jgi:hypothetical protein
LGRLVEGVPGDEVRHAGIGKEMHCIYHADGEEGNAQKEVLAVFGKEEGVPCNCECYDADEDADGFRYYREYQVVGLEHKIKRLGDPFYEEKDGSQGHRQEKRIMPFKYFG